MIVSHITIRLSDINSNFKYNYYELSNAEVVMNLRVLLSWQGGVLLPQSIAPLDLGMVLVDDILRLNAQMMK